jgi:hypothetical protein
MPKMLEFSHRVRADRMRSEIVVAILDQKSDVVTDFADYLIIRNPQSIVSSGILMFALQL